MPIHTRIGSVSRAVAIALLGVSVSFPATAAPTLSGYTGLIKIPTADVLPDGRLSIGFSWLGGAESYFLRPQTNRMYYASMAVLPGLEVTLDFLQVIGWVDPEAPGVVYAFHRLSAAKYRLPLPDTWPHLAVGVQDPFSVNAIARGPIGQTEYGLKTYYGVVSQPLGPLAIHVGYGESANYIQGAFAGADWTIGSAFNLRCEYDSRQVNAGLCWRPVRWITLYTARLFPDDWAYGAALNIQL